LVLGADAASAQQSPPPLTQEQIKQIVASGALGRVHTVYGTATGWAAHMLSHLIDYTCWFNDYADPEWKNLPRGLPRIGPPNKIVQTADEVIFLYEYQNTFRAIPTDCREHDPVLKYDQTFYGLAVGCWEGDTLVVTSMGFTDVTWLDWPGYFHSAEMKVIERLRREGDTLIYSATVDDPVMFLEPWVMSTRRLNLNKTPGVQLMQDIPYQDHSLGKLVDPENRG